MMMFFLQSPCVCMTSFLASCLLLLAARVDAYNATWESLDSRPLPKWYPDAKVGIFIHWGVFSVPAFGSEWFWQRWKEGQVPDYVQFVNQTETARFNYPDYAHRFDATLYQPDYWAAVFKESGAQYVVLTSKHHEGFCNWDSRNISTTWNWNSMDIGPRRDLLGDLAKAIRQPDVISPQTLQPLKFGVYHSMFEWFNPLFLQDQETNFSSQAFVDTKTMPELYHLVKTYKPEVLWSDGAGAANSKYWKSKDFLAWLATNSSVKDTVVWNDRWGDDTNCKHGSFYNCQDRYLPNETMGHYFENAMTLDKNSWGWNRRSNAEDYLTTKEVIDTLVATISRNGNLLVNVGPAADGTLSPIMVDRLLGMGTWLKVNGEGVYGTRHWNVCSEDWDGSVFYTRTKDVLYAHLTNWPVGNSFFLSCPEQTSSTVAHMLGLESEEHTIEVLPASPTTVRSSSAAGLTIQLPALTPDLIPCEHVWVIAFSSIGNLDGENQQESKEA
jgi:alpha-L-fucosidase